MFKVRLRLGRNSWEAISGGGAQEKSSEIFVKWSEILGKSSKTPLSVRLYNKKNIHVSSKI